MPTSVQNDSMSGKYNQLIDECIIYSATSVNALVLSRNKLLSVLKKVKQLTPKQVYELNVPLLK
ncbi:hypothetical protein ACTXT7_001397 [Hymenolepis weldensis]